MSIEAIITRLTQRAVAGEPTNSVVAAALTLEGLLTLDAARSSMTAGELYALAKIAGHAQPCDGSTGNVSLAFRPHGRLYVVPREMFDQHSGSLKLLLHTELPYDELQHFRAINESDCASREAERDEICQALSNQDLASICDELNNVAEHMAPLIHYVGYRCISNLYEVGKSGFKLETTFKDAMASVCTSGTNAESELLIAVYCLHMAIKSGGYTRLEELNSTQLSRRALHSFFDDKASLYSQSSSISQGDSFNSLALNEKAEVLADLRSELAETRRFIRLVVGVNFNKSESMLPIGPAKPPENSSAVTGETSAVLQRTLPPGIVLPDEQSVDRFRSLTDPDHLVGHRDPRFRSCLEQTIDRIVTEAVQKTNSDFGMTRGTRDYRRFAEALRTGDGMAVSGWSEAEYFCHVVPSAEVAEKFSSKALMASLNAISGRMRYNTWHYAPS